MPFNGIPTEGFQFLLDIRFHNNREWFNANKDIYIKSLKEPLYAMAAELAPTAQDVDPAIDGRPARIVSRIYKDARRAKGEFYRDVLWLGFKRTDELLSESLAFYFYLNPEEIGWGMGFYVPRPDVMARLRGRIDAQPELFCSIISDPALKAYNVTGESYSKPKKPGLPEDIAAWYNRKTFSSDYAEPVSKAAHSPELIGRVRQCIIDHRRLYRFVLGLEAE